MRLSLCFPLALVLFCSSAALADQAAPVDEAVEQARQFSTLALEIDSSDAELAGWQLRATFADPDTRIVGIEGGTAAAYRDAPHYDPRALKGGEIILAALGAPRPPARVPTDPAQPMTAARTMSVAVLHIEHATGRTPRLQVIELIAVGSDVEAMPAVLQQENGETR